MNQLLAPDTFDFVARYLIAGYIVIIARSRFISSERPKTTEIVVEAVIFSLINQMLFQLLSWPIPASWLSTYPKATFFTEVLILPGLFGFLMGLNLSRGWNSAFLRRLAMPVARPASRAHDYAFNHARNPGLVIVTYFDGTTVYGYFGPDSFASNGADHGDLYLERIYTLDDTGAWADIDPPRGAWITLESARSVEFLDEEEGEDG